MFLDFIYPQVLYRNVTSASIALRQYSASYVSTLTAAYIILFRLIILACVSVAISSVAASFVIFSTDGFIVSISIPEWYNPWFHTETCIFRSFEHLHQRC